MYDLASLRERYGSVFVYKTPDGFLIPWRPLTIQEALDFNRLISSNLIPIAVIEDQIFRRVVLDSYWVKNLDTLKAGIIDGIVNAALSLALPQSLEELNLFLGAQRGKLAEQHSAVHSIILFILRAFPAYKPEEVYAFDYATLMERLALAEAKMMEQGIILEPLSFFKADEQLVQEPVKPKIDIDKLKAEYEKQEKLEHQPPNRKTQMVDDMPMKSASSENGTFIVKSEDIGLRFASGQDLEDLPLLEHQLQQEASVIYKDYLEKMKQGKKVKIKSVEDRIMEANQRMEESKKKLQQPPKPTVPKTVQPKKPRSIPRPRKR